MFYAPHILQVKRVVTENDEFGRPQNTVMKWEDVGHCRCDDNSTTELRSENGIIFRPKYHVVCDGSIFISTGDYIRCLNGDVIRGEGAVYAVNRTNKLNYAEIWI